MSLALWSAGRRPLWQAPLCLLAGHLPDLDRSVAKRLGVKRRDHHRWVSHSPAGWLPPSVLALAAARGRRHEGLVGLCVLSLWVHLLLDTWADGIAWRWPVSEEKVGLFRKPPWIVDRGWSTPAPLDTAPGRFEAGMWAAVALGVLRR
jgi:LexA-binding, inner membrane-associated putative hydrolase